MSGIVGGNLGRGSGLVKAGAIDDNSVTLAKMAGGTDGNIISYDASGDPTAIATGDDGQVLTSAGAGQPPAFEAVAAGGDLSFGGDTFGADKTIGSNDTYALSFETDGNVAMKIDSAGIITKPLQSAFYGNIARTNNVTGDDTLYSYIPNELDDRNGDFSTSTFTAPVTGLYLVTCNHNIAGVSSHENGQGRITTSNRSYYLNFSPNNYANAGGTFGLAQSYIVDLDASDTLSFAISLNGGSKVADVEDTTTMGVFLLG